MPAWHFYIGDLLSLLTTSYSNVLTALPFRSQAVLLPREPTMSVRHAAHWIEREREREREINLSSTQVFWSRFLTLGDRHRHVRYCLEINYSTCSSQLIYHQAASKDRCTIFLHFNSFLLTLIFSFFQLSN